MNKTQFFGVVLVIIGLILLTVFPIFGIVAGEFLVLVTVVGGWGITIIGGLIVIVSLIFERMNDIKNEKFDKNL
ncbi:MAG: hypothetical protein ABID38_05315 [Candidatus Diapherotrites archaeon]